MSIEQIFKALNSEAIRQCEGMIEGIKSGRIQVGCISFNTSTRKDDTLIIEFNQGARDVNELCEPPSSYYIENEE